MDQFHSVGSVNPFTQKFLVDGKNDRPRLNFLGWPCRLEVVQSNLYKAALNLAVTYQIPGIRPPYILTVILTSFKRSPLLSGRGDRLDFPIG